MVCQSNLLSHVGADPADARLNARHAAPMERGFNHLVAGQHFARKFGRWPRPPYRDDATINDLIFSRMIDLSWSPLQRAFVDKSTAKGEALRLCPDLRVAQTLSVIPMESVASVADLYGKLQPFTRTASIAKASHASGSPVFLQDVTSPVDLQALHHISARDYAYVVREMQYLDLPRQVIVEALIPATGTGSLDDYKFHCVHGDPLLCQVDHSRFAASWSRLFRVPGFEPMDPKDGLTMPVEYQLPDPTRLAALTAAARALAAPFDFVRVDLYDGRDGVYFGELTFTPAAALGIAPSAAGCHRETPTHREYSRTLMTAFQRR